MPKTTTTKANIQNLKENHNKSPSKTQRSASGCYYSFPPKKKKHKQTNKIKTAQNECNTVKDEFHSLAMQVMPTSFP
jgi:hypothetical protein